MLGLKTTKELYRPFRDEKDVKKRQALKDKRCYPLAKSWKATNDST
jgi:hypothetical protein